MEDKQQDLKQLFQLEFSKMVAVISKRFGLQHIEIAEDVVSETFLLATETWLIKGMPANPTAWLYKIAQQKTLQHFRRNKIYADKIMPELRATHENSNDANELSFTKENIQDSQLQMMFAVCNPVIASESQIGLALRILCGFGIDEIAEAFLTNKETINKRLFRAKEKLKIEVGKLEMIEEWEVDNRLDNVLHIIYLLFSEGYYSRTQNQILQKELCIEAIRLCILLTDFEKTNLPKVNALLALMCFHSSRFNARQNNKEEIVLYNQQDQDLWDDALINQGITYFHISANGDELTAYHIEARIAYLHCLKEDKNEKWQEILDLYDNLLQINYTSSAALNRTYALYKVNGKMEAIMAAEDLNLDNNHFYYLLLGDLYTDLDNERALHNFIKAQTLAKTET
ncbi:MAG: DUF6596 domain-containing protein, partial [Bacteroidia bacterium]